MMVEFVSPVGRFQTVSWYDSNVLVRSGRQSFLARTPHEFSVKPDDDVGALHAGAAVSADQ